MKGRKHDFTGLNPKLFMNHLNKIIVKPLVIYQEGDISISVGQTFDHEIITLLKKTVYGTKGLSYLHTK
jgi:hypothetical protein